MAATLPDRLYRHLRRAIGTGKLAPGAVVPSERELMRRHGIGRASVREALRRLAAEGLIVTRQGARRRVREATGAAGDRRRVLVLSTRDYDWANEPLREGLESVLGAETLVAVRRDVPPAQLRSPGALAEFPPFDALGIFSVSALDDRQRDALQALRRPVVLLEHAVHEVFDTVFSDQHEALARLYRCALERGRRGIAFLANRELDAIPLFRARREGFQLAAAAAGRSPAVIHYEHDEIRDPAGRERLRARIRATTVDRRPVDALACAVHIDQVARTIAAWPAPERELGVFGFGEDAPPPDWPRGGRLTIAAHDFAAVGRALAQRLHLHLNGLTTGTGPLHTVLRMGPVTGGSH